MVGITSPTVEGVAGAKGPDSTAGTAIGRLLNYIGASRRGGSVAPLALGARDDDGLSIIETTIFES